MRRRHGSLIAVTLCAAIIGACTVGPRVRAGAQRVRDQIAQARTAGSYKCAPRSLALAERNVEFADGELGEGDFVRAEQHLELARQAIREALATTDPATCGEKQIVVSDAPEVVVQVKRTDRDGDGVPDDIDACIDDPEDLDGFQDEDGCPDLDHDGDGILEPNDKCPDEAEDFDQFEDADGCPEDQATDADGDGIDDKVDKCPAVPEDHDGFEDEDGCPDLDNDNDGVTDAVDKCPMEPGPLANDGCPVTDRDGDGIEDAVDRCPDEYGVPEEQGCPKVYTMIKVNMETRQIEIKQQIRFASGTAEIIGSASRELLSQVADALRTNPTLRLSIEGHTDSVGSASSNLRLSDARAKSVRNYLIDLEGLAPERLVAVGFGESRPLATNRTRRGRAANRRVEFRIIEEPTAAPAVPVP